MADATEQTKTWKQDPRNARRHSDRNVELIATSILDNGFGRSILLANDGTIIAGNATALAAGQAGLDNAMVIESDGTKIIAVRRTDVDPGSDEFYRLSISDNRAAELADWDPAVLTALQEDGVDLSPFWDDEELGALLATLDDAPEPLVDPDTVPDPPKEATTKPGDVWQIGRHRLMCGDSTVVTDVERLMGGERAAASITDPPYNVDIDYGTHKDNYSESEYQAFSDNWSALARSVSDVLLFTPGTGRGPGMKNFLYWFLREPPFWILIWVKSNTVGHSSIGGFNAWEPIFLYGKPKKKIGQDIYDIPITVQQDVSDGHGGKTHPTPKQVSLWSALIDDFTDPGDLIFDPFLGSGTALVAAEQLGRTCYGMELSPIYCDVIIARAAQTFGLVAELVS